MGPGTRFIVSSHNFTATPPLSELEEHVALCRGLQAPAPLVVKLVTTALDAADAMTMLGLLRATTAAGQPMIGLAMGEAGVPTRLLAGQAGALLSFATLDDGKASAPGQPFVSALLRRYRLREQRPGKTRVWGVVGRPVGHRWGARGGRGGDVRLPTGCGGISDSHHIWAADGIHPGHPAALHHDEVCPVVECALPF